jgi:hypothetical protein
MERWNMSFIDRQRVEAVRFLEAQGYAFEDGSWKPPNGGAQPTLEGDAIHDMMVRRMEAITGCAAHELELESLTVAIKAYEYIRWRA